ncbi:MAG: LanC-like protein [Betaproteobacteria bacterium]
MASPLLYEPERHEPLASAPWDQGAARAWIESFAGDAHRAYSRTGLWPPHPRDVDDGEHRHPMTMIYFGAAGVIWALDHLARAGAAAPTSNFTPTLDELLARNLAIVEPWGHGVEGLLMGQSGILLLRYRLAPDDATADAIAASIARNADHPSLELLWGSPSTMHVALTMHEWTGDPRWATLFLADAQALERSLLSSGDAPCRIWTQQLYGQTVNYIGAGHGFAGNASALVRGFALLPAASAASLQSAIVDTVHATALREGVVANWPPRLSGTAPTKMLVQWCHGSPGIVTSLAHLPDPRLDDVLVAAGELTWSAGPLSKGPGLCHGTAGNGYTFLKLFKRTGDKLWLDRARSFAMHSMAQSDRHFSEYGQRRYSLWTGDAGVAWYVWNCITGDDALPNLDPIA